MRRWTVADSAETYGIHRWGGGYFTINASGNLEVCPHEGSPGADLKTLVDDIRRRGINLPLILRFSDILKARIALLNSCFDNAIKECDYKGKYRGVYPIKVNQSRRVVEEIIDFGQPHNYGLEAGSKPELLTVMAMHQNPEALIVCNGYKDDEYIEAALLASKLGRTVVLVAEKPSEIEHIHSVAARMGIKATIGIRVRLSARGAGRWEGSAGDRSKFGLSASEMLEAVEKLRAWGELDTLRLLHFHLGSQISAIRSIKNALREAARYYVELKKLGCSALDHLDVGGGLGVDYDGSQTNFSSSMNYTVQEYANDVVYEIQQVCEAAEVPHPTLVTESGRAVAAHHSVLIVDVLEVSSMPQWDAPKEAPEDADPLVERMFDTYSTVSRKNLLEAYHDSLEYKDQALALFNLGHLSLKQRVMVEKLFWALTEKILGIIRTLNEIPEELQGLERALSDTYFLNFSVFQSLPDAWAVDQLFPIMPIHRLSEEPTRRGVLADITCDSDGAISSFIDMRDVKHVLELHPPAGQPYLLGIFLIGAYQEILGDMHNLFGDTNTVHVSISEDGKYYIEEVVAGDTISDVLRYVDYSPGELVKKMRANIEKALDNGTMTLDESRQLMKTFHTGLSGYTYLNRD